MLGKIRTFCIAVIVVIGALLMAVPIAALKIIETLKSVLPI